MTGLLIALASALVVALGLMLGARVKPRDMAAPAAALLVGVAGYAWQGSPGLAGHPVKAKAAAQFDERLAEKRRSIGERLGKASQWMVMSDALARSGDTEKAANIILSGLKDDPKNPDLWVGLGNALLAHGGGRLSPASNYAYVQALRLDPEGISPNYFYGLALAQSGQFDAAKSVWSDLIAHLPEQAELRAELVRNIGLLDRLSEQGNGADLGQGSPAP